MTRSLLKRLQALREWGREFVDNVTRIDLLVIIGLLIGSLLLCLAH